MKFDQLNQTVHSIQMPDAMKSRLKDTIQNLGGKKQKQFQLKNRITFVCVFTIILTLLISPSFFHKSSVNFSITASATSNSGDELNKNLSTEKVSFELKAEERTNAITSVSGGESNYNFTDITLQADGRNMETITYTINNGKFIEHITLTDTEIKDNAQLLENNIYIVYQANDTDIWQGIKEVGDTYTVNANEQAKYQYSLAIPPKSKNNEKIIINATMKYKDGKTEEQDIIVNQESDSITLKIK